MCGSASSSNKVPLPSEYSELYLCAFASVGGIYYSSTGIINRANVNGSFAEIFYLSGGYMPGDSRNVRVYIDGTHVWLVCFNQDGSDYMASAMLQVFYR